METLLGIIFVQYILSIHTESILTFVGYFDFIINDFIISGFISVGNGRKLEIKKKKFLKMLSINTEKLNSFCAKL